MTPKRNEKFRFGVFFYYKIIGFYADFSKIGLVPLTFPQVLHKEMCIFDPC